MLLYKNDGMSQKEMARALNLSPATMTVTLKRMEKAGLVLREMDEHDQRIQDHVFLDAGKKEFHHAPAFFPYYSMAEEKSK